jgi:alpha-tubulin suppressor-like RCC1 family protein
VIAKQFAAFAIGEDGEGLSWGCVKYGRLGHGDKQDQRSPKRVEALRGVRVSSAAFGCHHALALAEDGLVYAWGDNRERAVLGNPPIDRELLPKLVEALRGVRVGGIACGGAVNYAVADTAEVWAARRRGEGRPRLFPLGHGEQMAWPMEPLRGIKIHAVASAGSHTLALADDGSVYAWGDEHRARSGALGLGAAVSDARVIVPTPQRIPELRVACGQ